MMNERAMRAYIIDMVQSVIATHGLPPRPIASQVIAALALPPIHTAALPADKDGMRIGRQIVIAKHLSCSERVEFTIFHEILHILIEEDGELLSELHEHFIHRPDGERDRMEENLCQLGAAEFMVPSACLRAHFDSLGWCLSAIEEAARNNHASVLATAFQFAHLHREPCTMLACEHGLRPQRGSDSALDMAVPGSSPALYVAYVATHPESYPMCRYVDVPQHHIIYQAWTGDSHVQGEDCGFFTRPKPWKIQCEARRMGNRVYAAYYPKRRGGGSLPVGSGQGTLF